MRKGVAGALSARRSAFFGQVRPARNWKKRHRLATGAAVEFVVVDGATGLPIERYGVRVAPMGEPGLRRDSPPERTFAVRTATPRVRVLASDGRTPLAGVTVTVAEAGQSLTTGDDGTLDLGPVVCGRFACWIWPRALVDAGVRLAAAAAGVDLAERRVALRAEIVPGQDHVDLVAPARSGY